MIVTGGLVCTVWAIWKNFPLKMFWLLTSDSGRVGSGIVMEENDVT
jgi:hypothetical protein